MEIVNRVKNMLMSPKKEWDIVEGENTPHAKLFMAYVLPLSLIPAIAAFIGYGIIGYRVLGVHFHSIEWGIRQAVTQWVAAAGGVYMTSFVVNFLAEHFGAKKDFDKAFSLVAYAYTPMFVAGVFYILPSLTWLALIAGIYGLYILYIGLQPMTKVPSEKSAGYFVASLIATIVVGAVLSFVLSAILINGYNDSNFLLRL